MSQESKEPFRESDLDSSEYRERLMRKLNCLIAVLEVANAKVRRSLAGPAPDTERLEKIQTNLKSTLDVCRRARRALERREELPAGLPENLAQVVREQSRRARVTKGAPQLPKGSETEMSSLEEHERFASMGRISAQEVISCDMDELTRKLMD